MDIDFLMRLAQSMAEKPGIVGQVIIGKRNQTLFGESEFWSQISSYVAENNKKFRRYPSDAEHCMLASYFQNHSDSDLWIKLAKIGWKIENEIKILDHDYHSILFRYDSSRHLVLAFRGPTFEMNECFTINPQDKAFQTKMSQKLATSCYYAYLHARASLELCQKMNFWLSFTGHAFGAWLAELAVLHCYRESGTTRVRAVTFDSPGSGEMFYRLDDAQDFNEILDITTYLSCPNLVNTSSADHKSIYDDEFADFTKPPHHLGTVYFINDLYEERTSGSYKIEVIQELKDFSNKLIEQTNDEMLKSSLNDLVLKDNRFYLEGFRCLFSGKENLKWMLEYIKGNKNLKEVNLKRVEFWPKIRSSKSEEHNFNPNINYKELLGKIQPGLISTQIRNDSTKENLYSDISKIINVKMSCIRTTLSVLENLKKNRSGNVPSLKFVGTDEEFLYKGEHFLYPENLVENDEFKVEFWQSYQVQKADFMVDILRNNEIDSQLARFYFDQDQIDTRTHLSGEFNKLKEQFKIEIKWKDLKYDRRIRSSRMNINQIRDQFTRLNDMREIHNARIQKNSKNSAEKSDEENWQRLETFVEPENNILEKMDKILTENKTICIYGMSGCGKTTLAREYALYRKSTHENLSIVFINSGTFEDNVYKLKEMFLKSRDDLVKLEEILPLIESNISKWKCEIIFLFDDVKDYVEIIKLVLLIDPRHKIVITTVNSDISTIAGEGSIELGIFDREKCEEYLRKHGIDLSNVNVENFLKNETNVTASLIELFAKQLKNNLFNFQEMIFKAERKEQLKYIMDEIKKKDSLALDILKHLCYLDGKNIEFELIQEIFIDEKKLNLEKSLNYLIKTGYLKQRSNESYEMAGHIQNDVESILDNYEKSIEAKIILTLTNMIIKNKYLKMKFQFEKVKRNYYHIEKLTLKDESEFAKNNYNARLIKKLKQIIDFNYYKIEKSIEMADKVIKIIQKYCNLKIKICEMETSKGKLKHKLAKFDEALECFEKVLNIQKNYYFNENNEEIGNTYNNIGMVYDSKGEYDKAIDYFNKSLNIWLKILPENHPDIATAYNNIGLVYHLKSEYDKAINYFDKSLAIREKVLPANHSDIAQSYNNKGLVYTSIGEYDKAIDYFYKSLGLRKNALPANHPDIGQSYNNIGAVYYSKSEYDKAIDFFIKSLGLREKTLPANHPDIGQSYNNIGMIYESKGEYYKAIEYLNKSLDIMKASLPENHPDIATSYNNIGLLYNSIGEYDMAIDYYNKSLDIRIEVLQYNHPLVSSSYNNIGMVYFKKGEYVNSINYFNKCLDIQKVTLPENHPSIATSYNNIGMLYYSKDENDKAMDYYNKCLYIREETLPKNHPHIAISYNNIGQVYDSRGEYDTAIDYFNKSLNIWKKVLPENHPDIATSYNNIGMMFDKKGEYDKAIEYLYKCLNIKKKVLPENHSDIALHYKNIASVYKSKGEYGMAIEYFNKSLYVMKATLPENHPSIAALYSNIRLLISKLCSGCE